MGSRDFNLPDLGEGLEDAEVVRWLVSEGDDVDLNQPIVEVDTAKALVEIPSPFKGKVMQLHASAGETVKVGAPLVTFEVEGEQEEGRKSVLVGYGVDEKSKVTRRRRLRSVARDEGDEGVSRDEGVQTVGAPSRGLAPPPVRKLAAEMGVDIGSIEGTGPDGRITREDVLRAPRRRDSQVLPVEAGATPARSQEPDGTRHPLAPEGTSRSVGPPSEVSALQNRASEEGPEERIPVKGVRKIIAEKMARSASEIPHVTTFLSVDCGELLEVRREAQENADDVKISPLPVLAKAFIEICKEHPKLNATFDSSANEIILKKYYHLGIATDTERGLIVPVVRNADSMNLIDLAREIARLSGAVRGGTATVDEVTGSTVTISNAGTFGAEYGTPIINYPEAAILAFGVIEDRPAARDGLVVVRPISTLSLSFDHRMTDGAEGGRALLDLKKLLEDGKRLRAV